MTFERPRLSPPDFPTTIIGLTLTFSLAAYFRFSRLHELMAFATDQGRAMLAGRNILLGEWLAHGPLTSVGSFHLGPLYYYLTAIALWLSHFQPIGPAIMTAAFGLGTALILFLFVQKNWDSRIAVVSSVLFALSPLAAAQSRVAIEPSPLPFFTILWLWFATEWIKQKQARWFFGAIMCIILAVQLNFSAIILLPTVVFVWLLKTPRLAPTRKSFLFAAGSLFLIFWELYKSTKGPVTAPEYFSRMWQELISPGSLVFGIALFAVFLLGLWRIHSQARQKHEPTLILFTLFIISLFAFLLKNVSGDHALALLFPVLPIFLAVGFQPFLERTKDMAIVALVGLGILLALQSNTYVFSSSQSILADHQRVTAKIIELAEDRPYNFIYRGHLDVYDAADDHYQYLLWLAGYPPADSARVELKDEYRERWLLEREEGQSTIILYYPWSEADRYPSVGRRIRFENVILEVMDKSNANR